MRWKILPVLAVLLLLAAPMTSISATSLLKETAIEKMTLQLIADVQAGGYQVVSVEELKKMVDAGENLVMLDAHPAWEYDLAYVDGSKNIGFNGGHKGNWDEDVADGHTKEQFLAALGPDKNRKIITYCGFNLWRRSHNAAMWALKMGYKNVYRAPGGVTAWMDSGYPYKTNIK